MVIIGRNYNCGSSDTSSTMIRTTLLPASTLLLNIDARLRAQSAVVSTNLHQQALSCQCAVELCCSHVQNRLPSRKRACTRKSVPVSNKVDER
jgi:hypothetical protein